MCIGPMHSNLCYSRINCISMTYWFSRGWGGIMRSWGASSVWSLARRLQPWHICFHTRMWKATTSSLFECRAGERGVAMKRLEMREKRKLGEFWELFICPLSHSVRTDLGLHVLSLDTPHLPHVNEPQRLRWYFLKRLQGANEHSADCCPVM